MVLYGAQLSPSEAHRVVQYLSTQLGPGSFMEKSTDPHTALDKPAKQGSGQEDASKRFVQSGDISYGATADRARPNVLPEGVGRELVASRCVLCHSLEKAIGVSRTNSDWVSITNNMVDRGMKASRDETQTMIVYLQTNYGRPDSSATQKSSGERSK
jgi:mono/diheme cytochrome c family protein